MEKTSTLAYILHISVDILDVNLERKSCLDRKTTLKFGVAEGWIDITTSWEISPPKIADNALWVELLVYNPTRAVCRKDTLEKVSDATDGGLVDFFFVSRLQNHRYRCIEAVEEINKIKCHTTAWNIFLSLIKVCNHEQ